MSEQSHSEPVDPASDSVKAFADKVIGSSQVVPKKIPPVDDIEEQTKAIGGALASALLTATEMPIGTLEPVVAALAAQMVAFGVRQTEHVDPAAMHAPGWVVDGMRQKSVKLPEQPQYTKAQPFVARTATAPTPPARIAKTARAVRL